MKQVRVKADDSEAITEKQLSDLSSGIFLQNFDYIVYG